MFKRRKWRVGAPLAGLAALALLVAACGGDDDDGTAMGDAQAAPPLEAAQDAQGEITVCWAKDFSGDQKDLIERFNERFEPQGLKADQIEFPESADEQRTQFVQRQEAESSECDVFNADTVFMAELVAQNWLLDLTDYVEGRTDEFVPSVLETANVDGNYFGVPKDTDAPLLYYRTDQVSEPPATWQELYETAAETNGIAYQGAAYEGLTVDFLELAFAAGGEVLNEDGTESTIDSPENLAALELMADGVESGAALKGVTTYQEEEARRAFEADRATFMRNWPYAFALGNEAPKVKGKFEVVPLPSFEGAGTAGVLGGNNFVISVFSENPEGAMAFIDFATSAEANKRNAIEFARAPVIADVYDDPEVEEALPFAPELKQAVEQARVRPVSPVYPQITQAIYENVNAALSGEISPEEALKQADEEINEALETF